MANARADVKVVIIGAGLAGLSAANLLCGYDQFNVTLLEADTQVGGRIKTVVFADGTPVPLGATYFHGTKGNSIYEYYMSTTNIKKEHIICDNDMELIYKYSDGSHVPNKLTDEIEDCLGTLLERDTILQSPLCDASVYDYLYTNLLPKIEEMVSRSEGNCFDTLSLFEGFLSYEGISEGSKYVRDVSASTFSSWKWLDGDKSLLIKGNPFQSVVDSMTASLPREGVLHVDSEVKNIYWYHNANPVTITCSNGAIYEADHVIVTVSLGVLKELATSIFHPPLPSDKTQAINKLGFGLVNKIILQFDGLLFDESYFTLQLHWTPQDKVSPLVKDNPWLTGLHHIDHFPTSSLSTHFYLAWLCDEDALAIERVPNESLKQIMSSVLKKCMSPKQLPELLDIKITQWSNSYTFGSYSFTPLDCPSSIRKDLALPLNGKTSNLQLLFAGEATCCDQFSCAHPAYDTGMREAQRLIDYYKP